MDIGQTLTRLFYKDQFVIQQFMLYLQEIRQHLESEKINKIHSENNQFIINNNNSSSEQKKIQSAFTELRETRTNIFLYQFTGVFNGCDSHRTCTRHKNHTPVPLTAKQV